MSKVTLPAVSAVKNFGKEFGEEYGDVPEVLSVDSYPDGLTSPYFDRDNDSTVFDLGAVSSGIRKRARPGY